jgi:hypothetical protein
VLCLARSVSAQVIPLQCLTRQDAIPPILRTEGFDAFGQFDLQCTGGPGSTSGTTDLTLFLNTLVGNTTVTGPPILTVTFDRCMHLGGAINCPPGVPAGSNSLFFDPNGNAVFLGPNQTQIPVAPGNIFSYAPPSSINGIVTGSQVQWNGVPVAAPNRGDRIYSLFFRDKFELGRALFAEAASSSSALRVLPPTQSYFPGTNRALIGVVMPPQSGTSCDSLLMIDEPGMTPLFLGRNVLAGNTPFNVLMTLATPQPGQFRLDLAQFAPSTDSSCQGISTFNGASGTLDLQNNVLSGNRYWIQTGPQNGTSFPIARYGTGAMPPR